MISNESSGLYNFKLWESSDNSFDSKSDLPLGLITAANPGDGGILNFNNFTSGLDNTGKYYFVTCDAQSESEGSIQLYISDGMNVHLSGGELSSSIKGAVLTHNAVDVEVATDINARRKVRPHKYALEQNYPNPFNPTTKISYSLAEDSKVKITVYNVLGQTAATLVNMQKAAGEYSVTFDASNFSAGIYFYEIRTEKFSAIKKMLLVK
jgi:hypothetical protein